MRELSREAMQLLELMPQWELRPEYRPAQDVQALQDQQPLLVMGLATSAASQALWKAISAVMIGLGFPRPIIEDAVILGSSQVDRVLHETLTRRPAAVVCFGDALIRDLQSAQPNAVSEIEIFALDALDSLIQRPTKKAELWSALHRIRVALALTR
jgi:hypothetical protein